MLLSVHLVRIVPPELAAGGAPVAERRSAASEADRTTVANALDEVADASAPIGTSEPVGATAPEASAASAHANDGPASAPAVAISQPADGRARAAPSGATKAPALAGQPVTHSLDRRGGLRPWMKLNELARQAAACRASSAQRAGGTK
jgi:hypothetical protein